jgi:hypothetical protein
MTARRALVVVMVACVLTACGDERHPPSGATTPTAPEAAPVAPSPTAAPAAPAADAGFAPLDATLVAVDDTLDSAVARLGAANAVAAKVPGGEGTEMDGWILYPDDPTRRVYVYLDEADGQPSTLRVMDPESRWQRADGIRMGVTLAELVQRNGASVTFMGFDWDYGGGITDWNDGAFDRDPPMGHVTLCPPSVENAGDDYPAGDAEFTSDNAWVVAHPPTVCEFSVNLSPPLPAGADG